MPIHRDLAGVQVHKAYSFEYASSVERLAAVDIDASHIGKEARQVDDNSRWTLISVVPITWQPVAGASHSHTGADISGVVKTVNNINPDSQGNIIIELSGALYPTLNTLTATNIGGSSFTVPVELLTFGSIYESRMRLTVEYKVAGTGTWLTTAPTAASALGTYNIPVSGLVNNTAYTIRATAYDSLTPSFTGYGQELAATTIAVTINTPVVTVTGAPSSVLETPLLSGSVFAVTGDSDTHASSNWRVCRVSDSVVVHENLADTVNKTSYTIPSGVLAVSTEYSFELQYVGTVYGNSSYGTATATTLASFYVVSPTQKAIFGYGYSPGPLSMTNLVSNTGVIATDTTGVGTARSDLAAASYGGDKAIFGYGFITLSMTNKVSNTGVVNTDTTGVGTGRFSLAAASYGGDKAIFGYGVTSIPVSMTNLVSNTGVVATDTTGVGTARSQIAAANYGGDKAIFGYGKDQGANMSITNKVSNTGVVASDTTGVGTARYTLAAASYGGDKAVFGFGYDGLNQSITNLVSNTGVVATDTTGVGTARSNIAAAGYGGDKAIFGYGYTTSPVSMTNLVSNTGVVATDTTGVGTARYSTAAAGYSTT